jgi:hypothetical protein
VVEGGAAGSRTRSGAFASRDRSSTTATSPSKTSRRALRFHGGSGASVVPLGCAARTFLGSSFDGRFPDDLFFNDSFFNDSGFSDSDFSDSGFNDSFFNGSLFNGSFFDGSLSLDSRTGAPMIPSTLCWLAPNVSLPPASHRNQLSKNAEQKGAPKQHGITTGSRSDPNPRELKRPSLQKHPWDQSRSGHKIADAILA